MKNIQNRHGVEIGGFAVDDSGKRVVVCATVDNLNKGAATQCLRKSPFIKLSTVLLMSSTENMNLALGYAEYEGIPAM